jgi:hypothetical protein
MWNTSEGPKNHTIIQEGQRERCWRKDVLDVPGLSEPPFSHHPLPRVFIAHLLCLAQMIDSAGMFVLFFLM